MMRNLLPNKYNIFVYSFLVALAGALGMLVLDPMPSPMAHLAKDKIALPVTFISLAFGIIAAITRPASQKKRVNEGRRLAIKYRAELGAVQDSDTVLRMTTLLTKSQIDELYDRIPACLLPREGADSGIMDWYKWDVCFIVDQADVQYAVHARNQLEKMVPGLRIYLDEEGDKELAQLTEKHRHRVFYSGARFCVALVSKTMLGNTDLKDQLHRAMQRELLQHGGGLTLSAKGGYSYDRQYLLPIPLDNQAVKHMATDAYLRGFGLPDVIDSEQLQKSIVQILRGALIEAGFVLQQPTAPPRDANAVADAPVQPLQPQRDEGSRKATTSREGACVFISYSRKDSTFVQRLVDSLTVNGIKTWHDTSELQVGDSIVDGVNRGLANSRFVIAVLSKHSIASPWVKAELNATLMVEFSKKRIVLLPIVIDDCEIPPLLQNLVYADFRNGFDSAYKELLSAVSMRADPPQANITTPDEGSDCERQLRQLSEEELRFRLTERLDRDELNVIWFDALGEHMDDVAGASVKENCVIKLLVRTKRRGRETALRSAICRNYPHVVIA